MTGRVPFDGLADGIEGPEDQLVVDFDEDRGRLEFQSGLCLHVSDFFAAMWDIEDAASNVARCPACGAVGDMEEQLANGQYRCPTPVPGQQRPGRARGTCSVRTFHGGDDGT